MISETISDQQLRRRREWTFLILAGMFLGSLTMLNILGVSRFIDLSSWIGISEESSFRFSLAVGVLPYPITFLCTDLISEIYGRKRANMVVWVGLILNLWVLLVLWLGGTLEAPDNLVNGTLSVEVVDGEPSVPYGYAFYEIRKLTFGATIASMVAYIAAQFVDVHIFHFLKKKTEGKKLWLRNNVSTLTSQLIDSVAVILITHYYANALPIQAEVAIGIQLLMFILSSYLFKVFFALFDTIPIYIAVKYLRSFLKVEDELRF
ncbi:MAG: queuosine precursor transporter [Crocinitomicaceae bacterium]|nr:queuosine precursor transporter [Crocinitomicaceae bacterium]